MSVNIAVTLLAILTYFCDNNIHTSHLKQIQILVLSLNRGLLCFNANGPGAIIVPLYFKQSLV